MNFSTALRNAVGSGMSWQDALANGELIILKGSQPANADTACDLINELVRFSLAGAAYTAPVQCIAKIVLSGVAGSLDTISVGGSSAVTGLDLLGGSIANPGTAAALVTLAVAQINAQRNSFGLYAADGGADTIHILAPKMVGAAFNTLNLYAGASTTTAVINGGTSSTLGGAGAAQVGVDATAGLNFLTAVAGMIAKEVTAWQGTSGATGGTAAWWRYVAGGHSDVNAGTTDIRVDGSISTSGADMNLTSLTIAASSPQTINQFNITVPVS